MLGSGDNVGQGLPFENALTEMRQLAIRSAEKVYDKVFALDCHERKGTSG